MKPNKAVKYLWALPCSLSGLGIALPLLLLGAVPRLVAGVIEIGFDQIDHPIARRLLRWPFRGITFGHVVLAATHEMQALLRAHERVHVRQYEKWGLLFFLLYPLSSLIQLLRGRRPYEDNCFEIEARALAN